MVIPNAKYARRNDGPRKQGFLMSPQDEDFGQIQAGPFHSSMDISDLEIPLLRELHYLHLSELEE